MTQSTETLQLTRAPISETGMLIRRPVGEVFEAFVDPAITTQFWFTKSSGALEPGKEVLWEWEMYDASAPVTVKEVVPNERIVITWPGYGAPTEVEWRFKPLTDDSTFVSITERGFRGDGDTVVNNALASTGGFTLVLAGAKALLEHNMRLNLVADRFPEGLNAEG
jgi:uncharacterized protein YndB with AHSA1/START domain